jgi:hypothetical protein
MNKLKKLFSPRSLAATVGTAMVLHGTVTALAACVTVSAAPNWCGGPCGQSCTKYCYDSTGTYYWCCQQYDTCGAYHQGCNPPMAYGCGDCCQ